jgi:hypothetical protein
MAKLRAQWRALLSSLKRRYIHELYNIPMDKERFDGVIDNRLKSGNRIRWIVSLEIGRVHLEEEEGDNGRREDGDSGVESQVKSQCRTHDTHGLHLFRR